MCRCSDEKNPKGITLHLFKPEAERFGIGIHSSESVSV